MPFSTVRPEPVHNPALRTNGGFMGIQTHFTRLSIGLLIIVFLTLGSLVGFSSHAEAQTQATATPPVCPTPSAATSLSSDMLTEYTIPTANSKPFGIALGSDGALWLGEGAGKNIGRITTDGKFTEYPMP